MKIWWVIWIIYPNDRVGNLDGYIRLCFKMTYVDYLNSYLGVIYVVLQMAYVGRLLENCLLLSLVTRLYQINGHIFGSVLRIYMFPNMSHGNVEAPLGPPVSNSIWLITYYKQTQSISFLTI